VLGIAKGTVDNYVRDKQEILFECHNIALDLGLHAVDFARLAAARASTNSGS
jgi:AcrR family transcriptional regulator